MKHLYFTRHGETVMNVEEKFSGQIETPLTDKGRQQAIQAGKDLKAKGVKIDIIVASPLERAHDTAKLIAEQIGFPVDQIKTNALFMERSFGILENTSGPDFYNVYSYKDMDNTPGAETFEQLYERAKQGLTYLRQLDGETILVVSHGALGRAMRRAVQGEPHTAEYVNPFTRMKNAEVAKFI